MSLAQVVYHISNDGDFATLWRSDPDAALEKRGLRLSKEEKAFLVTGLDRFDPGQLSKVRLSKFVNVRGGW